MWHNPHDVYLEERILSADPLELVRVLYQAAIAAVRKARGHLEAGEIIPRARAISQAYRVVSELNRALDHQRGGELSRRLAGMYAYIMRRLLEANRRQLDEPLAEVLGLLSTLYEAWESLTPAKPEMPVPQVGPWSHATPPDEVTCSSHGWSF